MWILALKTSEEAKVKKKEGNRWRELQRKDAAEERRIRSEGRQDADCEL